MPTKITYFFKRIPPDHNDGNSDSGFDDETMGFNSKGTSAYFRAADGTVYNSVQAQPLNLYIFKPHSM